jgi:hypothetical protein
MRRVRVTLLIYTGAAMKATSYMGEDSDVSCYLKIPASKEKVSSFSFRYRSVHAARW